MGTSPPTTVIKHRIPTATANSL